MGAEDMWGGSTAAPPTTAMAVVDWGREERWRQFDNSVDAVSFGFVATAILILMFLAMAIFERFLRPTTTASLSSDEGAGGGGDAAAATRADLEAQVVFQGKLRHPSPKMTVYAKGVSVLMPGDDVPTYLAHPAPAPCPPEPILRPLHQYNLGTSTFTSTSN